MKASIDTDAIGPEPVQADRGPKTRRLHWGCGPVRPADWTNVDLMQGAGIDTSCDIILDGLPFDDDCFFYISSQHALQQLRIVDLVPALSELLRVLQPGGVLRLCLPDFDRAIEAYRQGKQEDVWCWDWDSLSGNFTTFVTDYNYTRTPLTYEFVRELLEKVGFVDVRRSGYGQTGSPCCGIVDLDSRPDESFYVEALKSPEPSGPAHVPRQVHLGWSGDPATGFTVLWLTRAGAEAGSLEFRRAGRQRWRRLTPETRGLPERRALHRVELKGLRPATSYEYRVIGGGDGGKKVHSARTAPPAGPADFSFAFLCDTGIAGRRDGRASGTEQIIEEIAAAEPLFVLGGGDYAYSDRDRRFAGVADAVDAWFEQMERLLARAPLLAQFGNHEVYLGERWRDWALRLALPPGPKNDGRDYAFDVGDVHFTALFVPGPELDPEQIVWLDADLEAARSRGARWLIVYQHEPIFGHGRSHPAQPRVRRALAPLFEKHRVDLHLSGHDQNYERTYPLSNAAGQPSVQDRAVDTYRAGRGVIYAKVSPSGKKSDQRNDFSRFTRPQPPFIAVRDDALHHYALVHVRAGGEVAVEVYGVAGDGRPGHLADRFRILAEGG